MVHAKDSLHCIIGSMIGYFTGLSGIGFGWDSFGSSLIWVASLTGLLILDFLLSTSRLAVGFWVWRLDILWAKIEHGPIEASWQRLICL